VRLKAERLGHLGTFAVIVGIAALATLALFNGLPFFGQFERWVENYRIATLTPPDPTLPDDPRVVAEQAGDGTPMVWMASGIETNHDATALPRQVEELYDMTDPSHPRAVTPPPTQVGGVSTNYWGSTYAYGWVAPRMARLSGRYLYRVANSIFDVHEWTSPHVPMFDAGAAPSIDAAVMGADASSETSSAGQPTTQGDAQPTAQDGCSCRASAHEKPSQPLGGCLFISSLLALRSRRRRRVGRKHRSGGFAAAHFVHHAGA